ncbi:hypothetical protein H4R18_000505 [Coemansia javaensis]|uniref:Ankyrin n=1 Tax=Coemansia javaensis TaxID=2761396 RepID=A0A9W8HP87_9FUNG|nr:hypothetical protein H4R18_000505 [Coemansia javaensis]
MAVDEREENLREMAALGNLKAVRAYVHGGVNVNSQNGMNGWTALHWAAARGHADVAAFLIRAGADPGMANGKGQVPLDVCRSPEVRALLPGHETAAVPPPPAGEREEGGFVPNYIACPDLAKAWAIPDDAGVAPDSGHMRQLQHEASVSSGGAPARQTVGPQQQQQRGAPQSALPAGERELLVYAGRYSDECLLGSVFVDADALTVSDLGARIRGELDGVPARFAFARHNGKQTVPVGARQEAFAVARVFRGADDAVVLRATDPGPDQGADQ